MAARQNLKLSLKLNQRMELLGRLRMAEWIEMPEREFAREIERLEKDPLFKKMYAGSERGSRVVRREPWPQSRISGSYFELNERVTASGERVKVEETLGEKGKLLPLIRKMGREAFERYYLYAEEAVPLAEIARRTGLTEDEARQISDLLLEIGAQQEFAGPEPTAPAGRGYTCLARLDVDGDEPSYEFFSPYWARGLYRIRYDVLEEWKTRGLLDGAELKRLPHLLKRMETVNLRQNTIFRIIESLGKIQRDFLKDRREEHKKPISLRMLAHRLDLAPSTVSRALSGRSIRLPWDKEIPLIELLPGRRRVMRQIVAGWLGQSPRPTDAALAERLLTEHGIKVSRRTLNAVRHELESRGKDVAGTLQKERS